MGAEMMEKGKVEGGAINNDLTKTGKNNATLNLSSGSGVWEAKENSKHFVASEAAHTKVQFTQEKKRMLKDHYGLNVSPKKRIWET